MHRRPLRYFLAMSASLLGAAVLAQPTWVVDPDGAYPGRQTVLPGLAYVEAATFPSGLQPSETGLFVACDGAAEDAYDVFLWPGALPAGAVDAAGTLEVLTRRDGDAARSARWTVDVDAIAGEVVVATPVVRALLLEDLRRGGTLAVRLVTDPAAGAAQPTFVFTVDGFPEDVLGCAARVAPASDPFAGAEVVPVEPAPDPFADAPAPAVDPFADAPAPAVDPFAGAPASPTDPFADAASPPDPFADAPEAPAAAPPTKGGAFDETLFTDPTTGLLSLFGTIDEFAPLPPRIELTELVAEPERALLYVNTDRFSAIGGFCNPEGGGDNAFVIEFASPAFDGYGDTATIVLYAGGAEVGYAELGVYRDNGTAAAFLVYDEDELGFLRAIVAFPTLEAVLTGDAEERAQAYWRFDTLDLGGAILEMACAPAF